MNDSVITSRAIRLAARCTLAHDAEERRRPGVGRPPPARRRREQRDERAPSQVLLVTEAASSAARISGWSRVCSWKPISRFARAASSARAFGSCSSGAARSGRTPGAGSAARRAGRRAAAGRGTPRTGGSAARRAGTFEVARELEPDLLEHLEVPARDALARALEGVERRVQLGGQAPEPRVGLEEAAPQQPAPRVAIGWSSQRPFPAAARGARAGPRRGSSARPVARPRSRTCTSSLRRRRTR